MDFTRTFKIVQDINGNFGFRIPPDDRPAYNAMLAECKKKRNSWATIKISLPRQYRSTGKGSQSHHINGHIQQICLETGNDFGDVKNYCKNQAISLGYPLLKDDDGNTLVDMWGNARGISETQIDTIQAGYLIEAIHKLAAEFGIVLNEGENK